MTWIHSTWQKFGFIPFVFLCISAHAESPLPVRPPLPAFSLASAKGLTPLSDVEFQKASLGVGRVKVTLPDAQTEMNVRRQGDQLIAEFSQAALPESLHRRMDVSDFATPIQSITTTQAGERVRMVIASQGQWEHFSYQADKQWVIEIKEAQTDNKKILPGSGYKGEKLSLHFQNIEVRSVLQVIADFTQFNVITSDSVTGSLTLRLQDIPWDQALDIILQAKGLGVRKNGNVLWVAPKEEIAAKDKLEFESLASVEGVEALRTQSFPMNYAKALDIAPQLSASSSAPHASARILSARGSVFAEPRTNQLFVTDTPAKLEQIQKLIAQLDIPVRQILIEARIVEASDTFGKSLGVKLGGNDMSASKGGEGGVALGGDKRLAIGTTYGNAVASTGSGGTQNLSSNFVNLPAVGQNGYSAATFALTLFGASSNHLMALEISALEADGKGKVVSSPRVITADQVKALIEQGTELPYQVASSSGATSIAFRKANLKLEVTPQITPEGSVSLDLDVTKDSVGQATAAGFAINTKHIKTQVLVENGGTVVIGGIFEVNENESETKVPVLGDLPGIGYLFKTRQRSTNKQEMLVFITPKVVSERAILR